MTRQAHPGQQAPPYASDEQKRRDALAYREEEATPWPVLVDDLEGRAHRVYGCLFDPSYLLDADGRVAYYNTWTHAPTLHRALEALIEGGGRGVVGDGWDRQPHPLAAITHGWRGLRRGLSQSYTDMELSLPSSGTLTWLGYQLRGALAPVTLRAEPLPRAARAALGASAVAVAVVAARALRGGASRRGVTRRARGPHQ
jgi:hypothetical protein